MKYFIRTFGCQQNEADSERIASYLEEQGYVPGPVINESDYIVINTCMIREMAENRVYGLLNNLKEIKRFNPEAKIVITGCMAGMAIKERSGKFLKILKRKMPIVDEFLPIEEIGFDILPKRSKKTAYVPISNGCNNFCTYCVVPFSRGREKSRKFEEVVSECKKLASEGFREIMLLGMNVNSYGSDLISNESGVNPPEQAGNQELSEKDKKYFTYVKHLGRYRIPTLFPRLLSEIARINKIEKISFMSSNPWDFSDELISVISENRNISREIHLPVQSGSDSVLKRMNRWYTAKEYISLVRKLEKRVKNVKISTDIIVGFCGETDEEFQDTVKLCDNLKFSKAYVAIYSDRPMTYAHKKLIDNVPFPVKKNRWEVLENKINKHGKYVTEA